MMKTTNLLLAIAIAISTVPLFAQPAINITACIDNTIYAESGNLSNGKGDYIVIGRADATHGFNVRRGLIAMDACFVPSNATVVDVELHFKIESGAGQVSLHKLNKTWNEGISNAIGDEVGGAPATAGDATWTFNEFNTDSWTTPGGDFESVASASALAKGETVVFSSPQMISDVQGWVNGDTNGGWIIIGNEASSGSLVRLKSSDILSGIPFIRIQFTIPQRRVYINEVNIDQQWIELFNPGPFAVDVSDWYLCNGGCDLMTSTDVTVLDGSLQIVSGGFLRLRWNGITSGSGEVALMKSKANYFEVMEDYMQYGSGNNSKALAAVQAGLWDSRAHFVSTPSTGNSIGLMEGIYNSGEDSNSTYWFEQAPTPNIPNTCTAFRLLDGIIALGSYAANRIEMTGQTMTGSGVNLYFSEFVEFGDNAEISSNSVFTIQKTACLN